MASVVIQGTVGHVRDFEFHLKQSRQTLMGFKLGSMGVECGGSKEKKNLLKITYLVWDLNVRGKNGSILFIQMPVWLVIVVKCT